MPVRTWVCSGTRAMVLCWSLHAQGQQCCSPWTLGACLAGSRLPWRHCPPARRCRMSCHGSRKPEPLPMHVCACLSRHHCRAFCSTGTATAPRAVPSTTPRPLFSSSLFLSLPLPPPLPPGRRGQFGPSTRPHCRHQHRRHFHCEGDSSTAPPRTAGSATLLCRAPRPGLQAEPRAQLPLPAASTRSSLTPSLALGWAGWLHRLCCSLHVF